MAVLIRKTGAKIILHSGWRMWFDNSLNPLRKESQNLVKMLEKVGIILSGVTPDLTTEEIRKNQKFSLVKANEILTYLETHKDITEWVVLDDLDLHNMQVTKHQVKTDNRVGLTLKDVEMAEKILVGEFG